LPGEVSGAEYHEQERVVLAQEPERVLTEAVEE